MKPRANSTLVLLFGSLLLVVALLTPRTPSGESQGHSDEVHSEIVVVCAVAEEDCVGLTGAARLSSGK